MKCSRIDGRAEYYVLNEDGSGDGVPFEGELTEWADRDARTRQSTRRETNVRLPDGQLRQVVTIFLGMDHAAMSLIPSATPWTWGTLVALLGLPSSGSREFFDGTRADAYARHDRIVDKLQRGEPLDGEENEC